MCQYCSALKAPPLMPSSQISLQEEGACPARCGGVQHGWHKLKWGEDSKWFHVSKHSYSNSYWQAQQKNSHLQKLANSLNLKPKTRQNARTAWKEGKKLLSILCTWYSLLLSCSSSYCEFHIKEYVLGSSTEEDKSHYLRAFFLFVWVVLQGENVSNAYVEICWYLFLLAGWNFHFAGSPFYFSLCLQ